MKRKLFCIYDSKVKSYLDPITLRNTGEALRAFDSIVNNPGSDFNKYPGDYTLFEIGEFDDETGSLFQYEAKINLGLAIDFKKSQIPNIQSLKQMTQDTQTTSN